MKNKQRDFVKAESEAGNYKGAVLEGRDIGTVVFPSADYKFYIDAPAEIRAERRYLQLQKRILMLIFSRFCLLLLNVTTRIKIEV